MCTRIATPPEPSNHTINIAREKQNAPNAARSPTPHIQLSSAPLITQAYSPPSRAPHFSQLIHLPHPTSIQQPLLPIQLEESPIRSPPRSSYPSSAPVRHSQDRNYAQTERKPGMTGRSTLGLEIRMLDRAGRVFRLDPGRVGDDFGKGFEDGCSGGENGAAGGGGVPVAFALRRCQ